MVTQFGGEQEMVICVTLKAVPSRFVISVVGMGMDGSGTGRPVAGREMPTGPVRKACAVVAMVSIVPAPRLTLPAPVDTVMLWLHELEMLNCACAPDGRAPATTTASSSSSIAATELLDFPARIAIDR